MAKFKVDINPKNVETKNNNRYTFENYCIKTQNIINLCNDFSPSGEVSDLFNEISKVFGDGDRLVYSKISVFVYGQENIDLDRLSATLYKLCEYTTEKQNTCVSKMVLKLQDHVDLALAQWNLIQKERDALEEKNQGLNLEIEHIAERVGNFKSQSDDLENKVSSITSQLISIVSIFTAISFIVFGGISSFQNMFSNLETVSITKIVIVGSVWGLGIINLVFFFIYYIAKITNSSIKTSVLHNASIYKRHPLIIAVNMLMVSIFIISSWLHFIKINSGKDLISLIIGNNQSILLYMTGGVFLIILLTWGIFIKKLSK